MPRCLISLGSNLGDSRAALREAIDLLNKGLAIEVTAVSRHYVTQPVGGPAGQGEFVNGAATLYTSLEPEALLQRMQTVEWHLGRERKERWGSRTIDLDLLLYDSRIVRTPSLTLPHPRMTFRRFVIEPAVEVAAGWVHPEYGSSLRALRDRLPQQGEVCLLAIAGRDDDLCRSMSESISRKLGGAEVAPSAAGKLDDVAAAQSWLAAAGQQISDKLTEVSNFPVVVCSFDWAEILQACLRGSNPANMEVLPYEVAGRWRPWASQTPRWRHDVANHVQCWLKQLPRPHLVLNLDNSLRVPGAGCRNSPVLVMPEFDGQLEDEAVLAEATAAVAAMHPLSST